MSGLLPLFKMTSPATTTAVVFGPHSRYPSRYRHPDLLYILFCYFRHSLSFPTVRLDKKAPPPKLLTFNKNHFLVLEETDLEQSHTIMELVAKMFNQYPAFTILFSPGDSKHSKFENKGNSPLVFINPHKVFISKFRVISTYIQDSHWSSSYITALGRELHYCPRSRAS